MWDLIAFIILVSIIFGVSLHDAFWGFISFIFGAVFFIIVLLLGRAGFALGKYKVNKLLTAPKVIDSEEDKARKKAERKKSISLEIGELLFGIWLFLPFGLAILFAVGLKDFTAQNPWIYIFALLPYLLPIGFIIIKLIEAFIQGIYYRIKKRTNRKS